MCTRYLTPDQRAYEQAMSHVTPFWKDFEPHYDVRITNHVPVIRPAPDGDYIGEAMYWTLLPPRYDSKKAWRLPTFNLRAERLDESRMYVTPFRQRRCLLPATGFYEWPEVDGRKTRHCIRPAEASLFFFAGLWNPYQSRDGSEADRTCGLITCDANPFMRPLHNTGKNKHRMPVILDWGRGNRWLFGDTDQARELLAPCPDNWLMAYPVTRNAGDVPEQTEPAGEPVYG